MYLWSSLMSYPVSLFSFSGKDPDPPRPTRQIDPIPPVPMHNPHTQKREERKKKPEPLWKQTNFYKHTYIIHTEKKHRMQKKKFLSHNLDIYFFITLWLRCLKLITINTPATTQDKQRKKQTNIHARSNLSPQVHYPFFHSSNSTEMIYRQILASSSRRKTTDTTLSTILLYNKTPKVKRNNSIAAFSTTLGDQTLKRNVCPTTRRRSSTLNTSNIQMFMIGGATALLSGMFMSINSSNDDDATNVRGKVQCSASMLQQQHPSPTPVGIGTEKGFEDYVDPNDELELPIYTRYDECIYYETSWCVCRVICIWCFVVYKSENPID